MIGCVIADDVDHRRARAPRIVHIGEAVGQPGSAVHQRRRRFLRHARVAVGAARDHDFGEVEHAAQSAGAIERSDEMHLGSAGIREADVHARAEQRPGERLCAIHAAMLACASKGASHGR